jgi:hypothetical protein
VRFCRVAYSLATLGLDGCTLPPYGDSGVLRRGRLRSRVSLQFHSVVNVEEPRCGVHGLVYWPVCRRAIAVALVVGTILMLINQADVLLTGHASAVVFAKIGLTYLVPFSVSTYSALAANRTK